MDKMDTDTIKQELERKLKQRKFLLAAAGEIKRELEKDLDKMKMLIEATRATERILLRMADNESDELLNPRTFDMAISLNEEIQGWILELKANRERAREEGIRRRRELLMMDMESKHNLNQNLNEK